MSDRPPIDHTDGSLALAYTASLPDGPDEEWLALPPRRAPRVLIERSHLAADAEALRDLVGHTGLVRRLTVGVAAKALAAGGDRLLGTNPAWSLVGNRLLGHARAVAGVPDARGIIRLSPSRPNSKPVMQLVSPALETAVAYVKIGWDELTVPLVTRETDVLRRLTPPPILRVPEILGAVDGPVAALALSALVTDPNTRQTLEPEALARAAIRVFGHEGFGADGSCRIGDLPLLAMVRRRLDAIAELPLARDLLDRLDRIEGLHGDLEVETGRWHGDWNRANAAIDHDGIAAWDWERSMTGAPLDLDAAFTLMFTLRPAAANETLQRLLPDAPPQRVRALTTIAALCSVSRHAESEALGMVTKVVTPMARLDGLLAL